jgi:hypothetical protein
VVQVAPLRRASVGCVALVLAMGGCDRRGDPPGVASPEAAASAHPLPSHAAISAPDSASTAPTTPASDPPVVEPAPAVTVENIGMHIGGGPNDAATKAPIAGSVAPHFDELRACWGQVGEPTRAGDFGVDLLIPADGGLARVSNARTSLGPDAFRDCVLHVFGQIDFARPRTGRTTVSYSLRFTPVGAGSP